ncbi:MAG TPA: class I SAM-dependent methyltransferase [bacterium]|nr:class I SAM-dependent methyltransferase [bacterium]
MTSYTKIEITDTGERILPTREGEISVVFSRHRYAYEYVQQFVKDKIVIDAGCGTGYGCDILAKKAQSVYGVDYDSQAIAYCKKNYAAPNITFVEMDANSLDLAQRFDIAVTFQVIEHMPNLSKFVQQLKQLVKRNGMIFISTPNVKQPQKDERANPFHFNEMNYTQFLKLISDNFSSFEILGVAYASRNKIRSFVAKLPFYRLGMKLKRKSGLKKIATRALDLTSFKIINLNVEEESADFLAVCYNI